MILKWFQLLQLLLVLWIIIIIIIIICKDTISFMQGIYTYIPETNHVPKEYSVLYQHFPRCWRKSTLEPTQELVILAP
jgi:predicted RND superfamily exporter protein